jgi:hypothetical protein
MAAVGSLMILIGSAGQARDSLSDYRTEFLRFREELGDSFTRIRSFAVELAMRLFQMPMPMLDEVSSGAAYAAVTLYLFASLFIFLFSLVGDRFRTRIRKRRAAAADREPTTLPLDLQRAKMRMRSLLRTALNWTFIMFGAIAVLIGATIDLIASW